MRATNSGGTGFPIPYGRLFVSAVFQGVDWFTLTKSAVGVDMATAVHTALKAIGKSIDESVMTQAASATASPQAPTHPTPGAAAAPEPMEAAPTEPTQEPGESDPVAIVDAELAKAAELLGVKVDATQDEIRAALRRHLGSSGLHPDHGGDGDAARRLIDAKNLLIERARTVVQS